LERSTWICKRIKRLAIAIQFPVLTPEAVVGVRGADHDDFPVVGAFWGIEMQKQKINKKLRPRISLYLYLRLLLFVF